MLSLFGDSSDRPGENWENDHADVHFRSPAAKPKNEALEPFRFGQRLWPSSSNQMARSFGGSNTAIRAQAEELFILEPWPANDKPRGRSCQVPRRSQEEAIAEGIDPALEKKRAQRSPPSTLLANDLRGRSPLEWLVKVRAGRSRAEMTVDKIRWLLAKSYPLDRHAFRSRSITPHRGRSSVLRKIEATRSPTRVRGACAAS